MPPDLLFSLLHACLFSFLSLYASHFFCLLVPLAVLLCLPLCFHIRRKYLTSPYFPQLCALLSSLQPSLTGTSLISWLSCINGSSEEVSKVIQNTGKRSILTCMCICVCVYYRFLWFVQSSVSLSFVVVSNHQPANSFMALLSLIMCKHNSSPSLLTVCHTRHVKLLVI